MHKRNPRTKNPFQEGQNAWNKYAKSITSNPYPTISKDHTCWIEGYMSVCKYKYKPVVSRAPEGKVRHIDGYVVVKHVGIKKKFQAKKEIIIETPKSPDEVNHYLGYIKPGKNNKPKRFFPHTNNPKQDEWKDKIACKSAKKEK